jgi:hypothetical protein
MASFKPLLFVKPTEVCDDTVIETDEAVTIKSWLYSDHEADGTEVNTSCTLADIVIGETVLAGYTTSHYFKMGVVTGVSEGKYFRFDGPNEGSMLWNRLMIVRGPMADKARERYHDSQSETGRLHPPPMKRTDSGSNYGFAGHPDLDFWERSGCKPWLAVPYPYSFTHDEEARKRVLEEYSRVPQEDLSPIQRRALVNMLEELSVVEQVARCLACGEFPYALPPLPTPPSEPEEEINAPHPVSPHWPLEPAPAPRQGAGGESGVFIGLSYMRAVALIKRMKAHPSADPTMLLHDMADEEPDITLYSKEDVVDGLMKAFGLTAEEATKWRSDEIDKILYD